MSASLIAAALSLLSIFPVTQIDDAHKEIYATPQQSNAWLAGNAVGKYSVVTDPRENPVRRRDRVPARWLTRSKQGLSSFKGEARPGEFYSFQISILNTSKQPIIIHSIKAVGVPRDIQVVCLNQAVSTDAGRTIAIAPSKIETLWMGLESEKVGLLTGTVQLELAMGDSGEFESASVPFEIPVVGQPIANHGTDEGWRLSRLKWLLPSALSNTAYVRH